LDTFSLRDICSVHETGLPWKALPDHAVEFKNECVSGGKLCKEKMTCLICAVMAGEKVPLLMPKYAKLWALKHAYRLSVEYRDNCKA
jgi:hypothetical protein